MSGSWLTCSCPKTHCLGGNCKCFKVKQFSSPNCTCNGCQNTENNKAAVDSQYNVYLKRKAPVIDEYLRVPPDGFPTPEGSNGCRCKKTKCMRLCGCLRRFAQSTSKCTCQDCANRGSDTKIELEQVDANSSMAKEPAQMQEQPTQSGDNSGFGQNKRPQTGYTASSVFTMSGSRPVCSSPQTHCLRGNCKCFKAKQFCSPSCSCNGCQNTENNKAAVDSRYKVYLKQKNPVVDEYLSVPLDGFLVNEDFNGCKCKRTRCAK